MEADTKPNSLDVNENQNRSEGGLLEFYYLGTEVVETKKKKSF